MYHKKESKQGLIRIYHSEVHFLELQGPSTVAAHRKNMNDGSLQNRKNVISVYRIRDGLLFLSRI